MKKLYFLFFLMINFLANAQIINFPDANFKARLLAANTTNTIASTFAVPNGTYHRIDQNNDNEISVDEIQQTRYLDLSSSNITNLGGIEYFINLTQLKCGYNQLTSLNVSIFPNLTTLSCQNNQLTSLNLSGLTNLTTLYCENNQLNSLELLDLSNLIMLSCFNNQLTSLNLSGLSNLQTLWCYNNQLNYLLLKNNNAELFFYGNPNLQYICADEVNFPSVQQKINEYGYTSTCHVNSYCSFTPSGTFYEISGNTKFDLDNNGCNISDINYSYLRFRITNGTNIGSLISNSLGVYYVPVQAGTYNIRPVLENPTYFNISPSNYSVNFPTNASPFIQNFCFTANGLKSDVEVVLLPTNPARPGFDADYKLVYRNKGNQIENGSVSLTFDDVRLDYVSSNPVYNSSASNSFTWNYTNLQPFETREIKIVFNVNSPMEIPAVNNGDVLNYTTTITTTNTDRTPTDNIFALDQTVVGSYDPNDKTCLQGTTITPTEVGNYVHYVIRFENTGTYPAENIVVKDMIDLVKFDIATLVPLKSSHEFYTRINENKVEFIFENINLDFNDATNDGYVVFKIKTKPTLVLGDTFTNNANIYFDYNFPITTNTYTTTVAALSTQDYDFGNYFTLYPNPAKNVLNIQAKQGLTINSIEIYNQLGQIVIATTNALNTIDVSNLAAGTYFVKINTEKGSANAKFVKE
ncbi:T9SS type A sorting domain-containing protein [Flavobacterium sp. HXWNR29]|uniref:T9SS type A sorting domain-containing protein n=1 Tax=Flavobacterium odoriferum TaxID=2946604 RepID=UPI0021CB6D71|nr:T9SS type A sorting domain-containing protein [Flavobacterium sp. HXWNR29]MCU4188399.1 T9SS type A sorting domain-containing protein [Flavobacterium sp. HXWNR29]